MVCDRLVNAEVELLIERLERNCVCNMTPQNIPQLEKTYI